MSLVEGELGLQFKIDRSILEIGGNHWKIPAATPRKRSGGVVTEKGGGTLSKRGVCRLVSSFYAHSIYSIHRHRLSYTK